MELSSHISSDLILWNVIEVHLNEAEFLFERWQQALFHPGLTLSDLARLYESRLFAHIDALVVGGSEVAEQFLLSEMKTATEPARVTAIALALLADTSGRWIGHVFDATVSSEGAVQGGLVRALILTDSPLLDAYLNEASRRSICTPAMLEVFTGRGITPPSSLREYLDSTDAALSAPARRAIQRPGRREIYYAAALNKPTNLPQCHTWKAQLHAAETMESALWHLGFCGTAEAGDLCAAYLASGNQRLVKLAADSLAWIGGLKLSDSKYHLSKEQAMEQAALSQADAGEPDADTILELDGVDLIPIPNAAAVQRWWAETRAHLGSQRCVLGKPYSLEAVYVALKTGPLWRRHHLAVELSTQTDGKAHVSTDAFAARQFRQLAAMGA